MTTQISNVIAVGSNTSGTAPQLYQCAGTPDAATYAGVAPKGALLVDVQGAQLYINAGTATAPSWTGVGAAGVPVLRGPYVVDYTDIPHDGSTKPLWTPVAGDVVLGIWADPPQVTPWDYGQIAINQGSEPDYSVEAPAQNLGVTYGHALTAGVPVQVRFVNPTDPAPSVGHLVLYALVARAVAP